MPYYDFNRHYSVKADNPKDAKVRFSRALENHEEDQYYVGTDFGFTRHCVIDVGGDRTLRIEARRVHHDAGVFALDCHWRSGAASSCLASTSAVTGWHLLFA